MSFYFFNLLGYRYETQTRGDYRNGSINSIGNNLESYWQGLISGKVELRNHSFNADKFKTRFACEIKNYDVKDHFDRKEARKLDPLHSMQW